MVQGWNISSLGDVLKELYVMSECVDRVRAKVMSGIFFN